MASGISSERHQALAWGYPRQVDNLNPAKFRLLERDRRLFIGVHSGSPRLRGLAVNQEKSQKSVPMKTRSI
ncbi:MAG: hypothetical protein IPJ50_15875 [Betaproteobacteria bacterium]|nr:hypothetical protein [Betaproteobacteria bacterium]